MSIDGRLNSLEEKLENSHKNNEYIGITEYISFPLKTKEDLDKLELDLQDADFFKNMVKYIRYLIAIFICSSNGTISIFLCHLHLKSSSVAPMKLSVRIIYLKSEYTGCGLELVTCYL